MADKLTYSTLFDPPPEMHSRFEAALRDVRGRLGAKHALHIKGEDVQAATHLERRSPIDQDWVLGKFSQAEPGDVDKAMQAAKDAFDTIEAGVTYVNRAQGATTGAWPGYQPFGGWKGSGNTGKGSASFYYLAQYLREQSQTVVQ